MAESCYRWDLVKMWLPADILGSARGAFVPSAVHQLGPVMSANIRMHQSVHTCCATMGVADLAAGRLLGMTTSVHPHLHILQLPPH